MESTSSIDYKEFEERRTKLVRDIQRELIGERYEGSSFSQCRSLPISNGEMTKIGDWAKNPKHFLVYLGVPGCGKTLFCACMLDWVKMKVNTLRYYNEREFFARVRRSMENASGDYRDAIEYLTDDDLVIFDDLGSSGYTDWRKEVLFEFIDLRYSSKKPTIITSNLTRQDLVKAVGERGVDRLLASENTIIENFSGTSFRQR